MGNSSAPDALLAPSGGVSASPAAPVHHDLATEHPLWVVLKPYANGGLAGMAATSIIQPVDMVKVRIQLGDKGGPLAIASRMVKTDGIGSLYRGLTAGLLRQATYTTARIGLYNTAMDAIKAHHDGAPPPLWQKAACALVAGGLGAIIGSPADLSLIRMQADTALPLEQRRNYKGVGDALLRIVKEDGVRGLFRGAGATAGRAMALNMGMLATNDQAKEALEKVGLEPEGAAVVLGSAMIAGFFASACSLPFDYVKTQMQKMKPDAEGRLPYSGPLDCALKHMRVGGPLKLYTGFPTYYVRIGSHATLTLLILSQLPKPEAYFGL